MRTSYSLWLIRRDSPPAAGGWLPHPMVLAVLVASALVTNVAGLMLGTPQSTPAQHALHVLLGVGCLLCVAICVLRGEREMIAGVRSLRRGGGRPAD